ncbi:uncharacterized protein ARMOST_18692 [Armillaria ostoyae]|uniref:DUF4218 domain-containing protein n=1 Tax=Armillaria ostoyae TaxID=47428 RepID=A0A284S2I9_ARMOS|nr:uncharacterized protein ARMOST_18692 [Armillaria ostoyae]
MAGQVFTQSEMEELWLDIEHMVTPSWVTPVPTKLGTSGHGKLKVDQWRVLGTAYLPMTLTRLWAKTDETALSQRRQQILEATHSLVTAVNIASSRTTSCLAANMYQNNILTYIVQVKELFPDYRFRPNHHMAIHLHEYLHFYGPVHSWWTFPFERVIDMLQRITTNYITGQYEKTIAFSFNRAARLRALLSKDTCPPELQNCRDMFERLVKPDARSVSMMDMFGFLPQTDDFDDEDDGEDESYRTLERQCQLPDEIREAFKDSDIAEAPDTASLLDQLIINGIKYTVFSRNAGNSHILISNAATDPLIPAQIEHIIQTKDPSCYLVVRCHLPADVSYNPFQDFPGCRAQMLVLNEHDECLIVIQPEHVRSHFASCPVKWEDKNINIAISMAKEYNVAK